MAEDLKPGYTRVSTILAQWDTYGHIKPDVLERKASVGTNVHEHIDRHIKSVFPVDMTEEEEGYFKSFLEWYNAVKPEVVTTEHRVYDDLLKITGAVDLIVKMPGDDAVTIVDWKTSASIQRTWGLQAGFYSYLVDIEAMYGEQSGRVLFIQLDKNGKMPKVVEYHITDDLIDTCMGALKCYRYLNR